MTKWVSQPKQIKKKKKNSVKMSEEVNCTSKSRSARKATNTANNRRKEVFIIIILFSQIAKHSEGGGYCQSGITQTLQVKESILCACGCGERGGGLEQVIKQELCATFFQKRLRVSYVREQTSKFCYGTQTQIGGSSCDMDGEGRRCKSAFFRYQ